MRDSKRGALTGGFLARLVDADGIVPGSNAVDDDLQVVASAGKAGRKINVGVRRTAIAYRHGAVVMRAQVINVSVGSAGQAHERIVGAARRGGF